MSQNKKNTSRWFFISLMQSPLNVYQPTILLQQYFFPLKSYVRLTLEALFYPLFWKWQIFLHQDLRNFWTKRQIVVKFFHLTFEGWDYPEIILIWQQWCHLYVRPETYWLMCQLVESLTAFENSNVRFGPKMLSILGESDNTSLRGSVEEITGGSPYRFFIGFSLAKNKLCVTAGWLLTRTSLTEQMMQCTLFQNSRYFFITPRVFSQIYDFVISRIIFFGVLFLVPVHFSYI